jgi:surface-anchored protein
MISRFSNVSRLAALAMVAAAFVAPARAGFDDNLYTAGHADISVGYDSSTSSLSLFYEVGANAVINGSPLPTEQDFTPGDVTVIVGDNVLTTGNALLPSPFAGNPLFLIMQTSQGAASRPFLGFGAESVDPGLFVNDEFTLTLSGFGQRPAGGEFIVYQNGSEANPEINTADGLSSSDSLTLFALGHDHYNLGFTTAGIYDLVLTASGVLASTGETLTATETYRFQVGTLNAVPEPGSVVMLGLGVASMGLLAVRRHRRPTA